MKNNQGYYLSFDISTTNVGIAAWDADGELLELKHVELKVSKDIPSEDRILKKADTFKEYVVDFKKYIEEEYYLDIINIFIEAPLSNTPKNINTTAMLLGFNGITRYILYKIYDIEPALISVHEWRSIFCSEFVKQKKQKGVMKNVLSFPKGWKSDEKKEHVRQKVAELHPEIEWFYTRNNTIKTSSYDMADAYGVGYASLKILGIIN